MNMAAYGFSSNSDFHSSTLSQQPKLSPFSKITSFSDRLFGKFPSETTSPLYFSPSANPFNLSPTSSRPTFPDSPPSKRWGLSEVPGLKAAMLIANDDKPEKPVCGNLVLRSSMKFNIPDSTPHLQGGSMKTNPCCVVFSIGDDGDDNPVFGLSTPCTYSDERNYEDPMELDHFGGYSSALPPSVPVRTTPYSHTGETRVFVYGSGSSGQENMSMVTCSPIKGKIMIPEGQLINEQIVLPLLVDTEDGLMAFETVEDMEEFEYICITTRGPNPRKTHIFSDYILGHRHPSDSPKNGIGANFVYPSSRFLTYCYGCKKELDHKEDVYIYRSDRAFCSKECREQEILWDEKIMKMKKEKAAASTSHSPHGSS